jgi:hypothetical protein
MTTIECMPCGGTGKLAAKRLNEAGQFEHLEIECARCGGTGESVPKVTVTQNLYSADGGTPLHTTSGEYEQDKLPDDLERVVLWEDEDESLDDLLRVFLLYSTTGARSKRKQASLARRRSRNSMSLSWPKGEKRLVP